MKHRSGGEEALEERVGRLERQNRLMRIGIGAGVLVAIFAATRTPGITQAETQTIYGQYAKATLSGDGIQFSERNGNLVRVGVLGTSGGGVTLGVETRHWAGRYWEYSRVVDGRFDTWVGPDQNHLRRLSSQGIMAGTTQPALEVYDPKGTLRGALGIGNDASASMGLFSANGSTQYLVDQSSDQQYHQWIKANGATVWQAPPTPTPAPSPSPSASPTK